MIPDPRERPTMSVADGGALFGLGRSSAYTEAARFIATEGREGLPVVKFGRRLVVPTARVLTLLGLDPGDAERGPGRGPASNTDSPRQRQEDAT